MEDAMFANTYDLRPMVDCWFRRITFPVKDSRRGTDVHKCYLTPKVPLAHECHHKMTPQSIIKRSDDVCTYLLPRSNWQMQKIKHICRQSGTFCVYAPPLVSASPSLATTRVVEGTALFWQSQGVSCSSSTTFSASMDRTAVRDPCNKSPFTSQGWSPPTDLRKGECFHVVQYILQLFHYSLLHLGAHW